MSRTFGMRDCALRMASKIDIDQLYERHQASLLRWFARRTADPQVALDLWAETFAQAVRSSGRFRGSTDDDRASWLYTIARNQLASYLRKGYAEQRAMARLGIEREPASDALLREVEARAGLPALRAELRDALGELSDETRRAVALRVVDEQPYREVARILEITEVAARARVSRGLQTLAASLDPALTEELT
ncbi:MAG: RNA polymerase sigma factor [Solirubrobacteraceae bacterium]|nr:RNA polymerase sigma factor [Solirubrobacteraceae bacterium]